MYVLSNDETTIAFAKQNAVIAITIINDYPNRLWEQEANINLNRVTVTRQIFDVN